MSACLVSRYFFPDIRFCRNDGPLAVRPISKGGAQITHGGFRGAVVRLHRTSCANVLPAAGKGFADYVSIDVPGGGGGVMISPHSPLCLSTEKGVPQHIPRYADVGPVPSVSGVAAAHASARQRRERYDAAPNI